MRVKLSDICDIYDGPHATPKPTDDGPIFLGIKNINEYNQLDLADVVHLSPNDFEKWTKRVTPMVDDIVFSYEATLNRYALIPDGFYGCLGRRLAIARVKDKEKVNPHYLYHYFCSPFWNRFILANKVIGSTVLRVSIEDFPNYEVELPDIDTQNKICGLLDDITENIENNKAICANLESMAKLLYDYWFVQFDFPDENGKPYKSSGGKMVWNEELNREIPEGWCAGKLTDLANIVMGQSPSGDSYNESGEGVAFYQGRTDFGLRYPSPRMYTTAPTKFAKKGDILLSVRAPVGDLNFAMEDCCIGRGLAALSNKLGSQMHLYYVLNGHRHIFDVMNDNGTTFGAITKDILFDINVVIPTKDIVQKFERMTGAIESQIENCESENRELAPLRDFLLPMLMNGQVKIKDSESEAK